MFFRLCPLAAAFSPGTTERNPAPLSWFPPWDVCTHWWNPPLHPTLIWAEESHLSVQQGWPSVSIIFLALQWTCSSSSISLLPWGAQSWTQHFRCSGAGLSREEGSPLTCWQHSSFSAQNTHGLFYCKSALLAHVMPQLSLLPSRTSSKAAFQSPGPQHGLGFFYSTPGAGYCLSLCGNSRDFTFSSLLSIISRQVTAQPHLLLNLHRFFFKGCLCYTRF